MLLIKINDLKIDGCQPIDVLVERPRETRLKWMEFYDNGNRFVRLSHSGGTCDAIMLSRPTESMQTIGFKLEPVSIKAIEIWNGATGKLSSVYTEFRDKCYQAFAMNGWKFNEAPKPEHGEFHRPSSEAEDRINYFIRSQVTP